MPNSRFPLLRVLPLLLLTACAPFGTARMPDASIIHVDASGHASVPDCTPLTQSSYMWDTLKLRKRPAVAFGCATQRNLATMIADPNDLLRGRDYAGQDATTASSAVQRYKDGKVTPLRDTSSTDGQQGSNSGGGSGGGGGSQ